MKRILPFCHELLASVVREGDIVVDATLGNGYDAFFLASCIGVSGTLFGFDIQLVAIENSQKRLQSLEHLPKLYFLNQGHETLASTLERYGISKVNAVTFNLGYLPGGNKEIITEPTSTLLALQQSLDFLQENGIITIVVYQGHQGAKEESGTVLHFAKTLSSRTYDVLHYQFINKVDSPILIVIRKI